MNAKLLRAMLVGAVLLAPAMAPGRARAEEAAVLSVRVDNVSPRGGKERLAANRAHLVPHPLPPEHADDGVADRLGVGAEVEQDLRRDTFVHAGETEQDVLGADVLVAEGETLALRELERLLRARRKRDLAGRDAVALPDDPQDLRPHFLHRHPEGREHPRREALLLTEQPEQEVLGADVVVLERPGVVLGEDDDLPRGLGEPLEHSSGGYC